MSSKIEINRWHFFQLTFILLCIAGLGWQFIEVNSFFFKFKTTTRVTIDYPEEFIYPSLSVCIRYTDILDYEKANLYGKHNWSLVDLYPGIQQVQKEIRVDEIFNYTPSEFDIIKRFHTRGPTGYEYEIYETTEKIKQQLNIKKYVHVEYICYKLTKKNLVKIKTKVIMHHPVGSGIISLFDLSPLFVNVSRYKLSIHGDNLPCLSLPIQPSLQRSSKQVNSLNAVLVSPGLFQIHNLPPPYVTSCRNYLQYNFIGQHDCIQSCVSNKSIEKFSKHAYSTFITKSSSKKIISFDDIKDSNFANQLESINIQCEKSNLCRRKSCKSSLAISYLQFWDFPDLGFVIQQATPHHPWIYVHHEAAMNFVTYLTFIMGAFGTWTGLSVISLSPFKLAINMMRNKNRKKSKIKSKNNIISSNTITLLEDDSSNNSTQKM